MPTFPPITDAGWFAIAAVAVSAVLAMLYALSAQVRDFERIEKLKLEVLELRRAYAERLRALGQNAPPPNPDELIEGEFDIVATEPDKPSR